MKRYNHGAALITVMIVVFIIMAIISNLTVTNFRTIKRLSNRQLTEQASSIALSAIDFGRAGLGTSGSTSSVDTLKDIWAQPLPRTKLLDDIYMSGYVVDEQSKFNLNDLVNASGQINNNTVLQFTNLLSYINLPPSLAYNIAYYIASPQYQSDISSQYTMANPPSRPAGRPFVDLSELILVKGVTPEIVNKLVQYVTAIPVSNYKYQNESSASESAVAESSTVNSFGNGLAVNVNTAAAEVIAAKSGISLTVAQRLLSAREAQAFQNTGDVTKYLAQNGVNANTNQANGQKMNLAGLAVTSSYFTIHAVVDDQEDRVSWVALVYRQNRSGQWPQILWLHPE